MTGTVKSKPKKRGRPKKVALVKQENLKEQKLPEEITNWEDEGGAVLPEKPEEFVIDAKSIHRKQQWDSLDNYSKAKMRMTEQEFLVADDVTGFGPNSYFTPLSER